MTFLNPIVGKCIIFFSQCNWQNIFLTKCKKEVPLKVYFCENNKKNMFTATTTVRVRYAETDQMGFVYYGNYAQYFEVGRVESIRQLGYTYKQMEEDGIIMPVVEINIKYLKPGKYDDLLTIKTTIKAVPEAHKITFYQEVYNENNVLLTIGEVTLFFMHTITMQRSVIPHNLGQKLASYF